MAPLLIAISIDRGWETATHYLNDGVNFAEPLFVIVIMALASTRPIIELAEGVLRRVAQVGGATPAAWWVTILIIAPLLGSFITEPGAMTIAALLLARQFYDLQPGPRLKDATLGLLFVNISIGGTLTHFAAPPALMVARPWGWDTTFMLTTFGWRLAIAVVLSTLVDHAVFRRELRALAARPAVPDVAPLTAEATLSGRRDIEDSVVGHRRLRGLHGVDGRERALPGVVPAGFLLSRLRPGHGRLLDADRLQDAAAGGLLPRRAGDPRRAPELVARAGARAFHGNTALHRLVTADSVQRQRSDQGPSPRW